MGGVVWRKLGHCVFFAGFGVPPCMVGRPRPSCLMSEARSPILGNVGSIVIPCPTPALGWQPDCDLRDADPSVEIPSCCNSLVHCARSVESLRCGYPTCASAAPLGTLVGERHVDSVWVVVVVGCAAEINAQAGAACSAPPSCARRAEEGVLQ